MNSSDSKLTPDLHSSPIKRFSLLSLGSRRSSIPSPSKIRSSPSGLLSIENHGLFKSSYQYQLTDFNPAAIDITLKLENIPVEDAKICRICLGQDNPSQLISPCSCTGSHQFVHEECLKSWLITKKIEDISICEVCLQKFNMEFTVKTTCMPFRNLSTCKAWVPCMISMMLIIVIIYVCYLAFTRSNDDVFITVGVLVLGFICIACCVKGGFATLRVCFERRIEVWKIIGAHQ